MPVSRNRYFLTAVCPAKSRAASAPEAFLPALVALLEVPGILIALAIAARGRAGTPLGKALHEVVTGSSILLLVGGMVIGTVSGPAGMEQVAPGFVAPFAGVAATRMT